MITHDMEILINWFKANQLSLNMDKTTMIKFWLDITPFEIQLEDITIKTSKSTKFLGVTIDDNLSWSTHVNNLLDKLLANKRLLQNAKKSLLNSILKPIYYAHIHSHLIYGLSIWGNMINEKQKKIYTNCKQTA